jgi:hypothetical protein
MFHCHAFYPNVKKKEIGFSQQHGKALLRYPVGKIVIKQCEEGHEEMTEHSKTRRKKRAARLYTSHTCRKRLDVISI